MEDAREHKVVARAAEAAMATATVAAATAATTSAPPPPIPAVSAAPAIQAAAPVTSVAEPVREALVAPQPSQEPVRDPPRADYRSSQANRRDGKREPPPKPVLTALNTSLVDALYWAQQEGLLTSPPPNMRSDPRGQDARQWCQYHRDHGHLTNDCRILQRDIEHLIQRGFLRKYADQRDSPPERAERRSRSRSPRPQQPAGDQPPAGSSRGTILAISGGPAAGGTSNNARKKYAKRALQVDRAGKKPRTKEPISFGDFDLEGVETPHEDPIIITAGINGFQVKRVMVDTGSSADILYIDAFNQMGIDQFELQPCLGPIIRFTGHAIIPKGIITLPLTVGEPPRQSTVQTQFLVMNIKSAYNVILGRAALNNLRAIPSTYHQMVKFPTPMGVEMVRSNQREARSCYMLSMKGKGTSETLPIDKTSLQMEKKMERERG